MKHEVVPNVIITLGTVSTNLDENVQELGIWGRFEIIKMTTLLKIARILRRVLEYLVSKKYSNL